MNDLLERASFGLLAFAAAVLPARIKARPRWRPFSTTAGHACSGVAEIFAGVAVFFTGFASFVSSFNRGPGYSYLAHQPTLHYSDFFAMGALGYLSYLLHPVGMLGIFLLVEGVVRALDAALTGRHLGLAFLSLPHWLFLELRRRGRAARLQRALGGPRPDVVLPPEATPDGTLVVVSRDRKAWSDVQVVSFDGRFYQLTGVELVREGRVLSWRYRLRALDPTEIIRGTVVTLERPAAAPRGGPGPLPPEPGPDPLTGRLVRRG